MCLQARLTEFKVEAYLIKGLGSLHACIHVQPCRLDDLKGDVQAQLVEEVGHLLAQPVRRL